MTRIILASASPRRNELTRQIGLECEIMPSDLEEDTGGMSPRDAALTLSLQKAAYIAGRLETDAIVIGADTVVAADGHTLGKPSDAEDARHMLRLLSGRAHHVYTGVTIIVIRGDDRRTISFTEKTEVRVTKLTEDEIDDYIESGDPMDKAGAYGIQGIFSRHVSGITGDYFNVVGLPVSRLYQEIKAYL